MFIHNLRHFFLIVAWISGVGAAQTVAISGKVTDTNNIAVPGAVVRLEALGRRTLTREDGTFTLSGPLTGSRFALRPLNTGVSAEIRSGTLWIHLHEQSPVAINAYDLLGRTAFAPLEFMKPGDHPVALPRTASGIILYRITTTAPNRSLLLKAYDGPGSLYAAVSSADGGFAPKSDATRLSRVAVLIDDTLITAKDGFLPDRLKIVSSDISGLEIRLVQSNGIMTDADGNTYQTLQMGALLWMAEDLRTTTFRDATPIPLISGKDAWHACTSGSPACCCSRDSSSPGSIQKYGAFYNWFAVNTGKLAPSGWHVPSSAEWDDLSEYVMNTYGDPVAPKMAVKTDWLPSDNMRAVGFAPILNNQSGFSGFPAGDRGGSGVYDEFGQMAAWWSPEGCDTLAYFVLLGYGNEDLVSWSSRPVFGYSIRLCKKL